jgi:ribosome-associated toxin RatA of RatAB toxin-antitoxin module
MPTLNIKRHISGATAAEIFKRMRDIEKLPEISESVQEVSMSVAEDGAITSIWEVSLRGSIMQWTEIDEFDEERLRYGFRQISGDLARLEGFWQAFDQAGGVLVELSLDFDLGMPSLAKMLNPIAAKEIELWMDDVVAAWSAATLAEAPALAS